MKKRITMRNVRRADMPEIAALHEKQKQRDGTAYPLPQLINEANRFPANIPLALTFDQDGTVRGALYFERPADNAVEACFAGCDPRCTIIAAEEMQSVLYTLKSLGITTIYCLVPETSPKPIVKALKDAGFKDKKLRYFAREV